MECIQVFYHDVILVEPPPGFSPPSYLPRVSTTPYNNNVIMGWRGLYCSAVRHHFDTGTLYVNGSGKRKAKQTKLKLDSFGEKRHLIHTSVLRRVEFGCEIFDQHRHLKTKKYPSLWQTRVCLCPYRTNEQARHWNKGRGGKNNACMCNMYTMHT